MDTSGFASRRQLLAAGLTSGAIARAVATGSLLRVRRGRYCTPTAPTQVIAAARAGGSLTCASALVHYGVWMRAVDKLHVAFPHAAHRSVSRNVVAHWCRDASDLVPVENPLLAFTRFVRCGSELDVVIAADSLLNQGLAKPVEIEEILRKTTVGRRILARIDGRAESGTESIVRLWLRAHGIKFRCQVAISGVGRVDFVIGDRLVVEVDGREWHDQASQFERDRARDAVLVARGYLVIRISYNRVMHDLAEVEREILAVVRAEEHRRRPIHDRIERNYGRGARS